MTKLFTARIAAFGLAASITLMIALGVNHLAAPVAQDSLLAGPTNSARIA